MDSTPTFSRFDDAYKTQTAPWVIGEPQPAIVDLERSGLIRGKVLDVGCGTGEHTILLTRLGYDVLGVDAAPTAVEQARANAAEKGVDARFEVADAMNLGSVSGRAALRHRHRQRAVSHLRRHRPAQVCREPARRVPAGRAGARAGVVRQRPRVRSGGQRERDPRGVRRRLGARGAGRRRRTAASSRNRTSKRSACRSGRWSTSRRGWPAPAASDAVRRRT